MIDEEEEKRRNALVYDQYLVDQTNTGGSLFENHQPVRDAINEWWANRPSQRPAKDQPCPPTT